jgi:hypothetical protein
MECENGSERSGCADEQLGTAPPNTRCTIETALVPLREESTMGTALTEVSLSGDYSLTSHDQELFAADGGAHAAALASSVLAFVGTRAVSIAVPPSHPPSPQRACGGGGRGRHDQLA